MDDIATEAARLASTDRDADYGDPAVNLARTGRMWGAILGIPDVTPEQVGMCMVAVKLSRQCHEVVPFGLVGRHRVLAVR